MQALECLSPLFLPLQYTQTKHFLLASSSSSTVSNFRFKNSSIPAAKQYRVVRIYATETVETSTVDYSSLASVFPAEACETIGGDACNVDMFPEVKLPLQQQQQQQQINNSSLETIEREYVDYTNDQKTVFVEEACDDLGGEFCDPGYLQGARGEPAA